MIEFSLSSMISNIKISNSPSLKVISQQQIYLQTNNKL